MLLQDMTGQIQAYVNRKALSPELLADQKHGIWAISLVFLVLCIKSGKGDLYVDMQEAQLTNQITSSAAWQASRFVWYGNALSPALRWFWL